MKQFALLLSALLFVAFPALAQAPQPTIAYVVTSTGTGSLSASTTSGNVAIPAGGPTLWVQNTGTVPVCVALGTSSAVKAVLPCPASPPVTNIAPGATAQLGIGSSTYIAAITGTGTASLVLTSGYLTLASDTIAGSVTANQGTPNTDANAWPVTLVIGGALNSATNGTYTNLLQGNAVLSTTNPLFFTPATGANLAQETGGNLAQSVTDFGAPGATACATDTSSCNFNQLFQRIAQRLSTINTTLNAPMQTTGGAVGLVAGTANIGGVALSPVITNPTSTLTLPSSTSAYTAGQLIANNATAGSITVPSFAIATSAGAAAIPRLRLSTNDTTSTSWGGVQVQVDLWSAAPTWTNGDHATWLPATGSAVHLGAFTCAFPGASGTIWGDGLATECYPQVGNFPMPKLASGTSIFWSLQALTASGVIGASKVFTLTAELQN